MAASSLPQRNAVPSAHIRCRIAARLRATAIRAPCHAAGAQGRPSSAAAQQRMGGLVKGGPGQFVAVAADAVLHLGLPARAALRCPAEMRPMSREHRKRLGGSRWRGQHPGPRRSRAAPAGCAPAVPLRDGDLRRWSLPAPDDGRGGGQDRAMAAGDRQAKRRRGLWTVAQALNRGAHLRLARPLPQACQGLREPRRQGTRLPLLGHDPAHAVQACKSLITLEILAGGL